jgi:phage terminase large subunit GpA-like protein
VRIAKRTGHTELEWQVIPGRENHWLDCRVYARAAAAVAGLDRMAPPPLTLPAAPANTPRPAPRAPRSDSRFGGFRGKGWFGKR